MKIRQGYSGQSLPFGKPPKDFVSRSRLSRDREIFLLKEVQLHNRTGIVGGVHFYLHHSGDGAGPLFYQLRLITFKQLIHGG
jgi:hypothetical protein